MKMYVWSDALAFLAVAQANSVQAARALVFKEMGENGDGSCPERDKARESILSTNPVVYYGENAEFALTDSAEVRELEAYIKRNRIDQRADLLNLKIEQLTAELETLRTKAEQMKPLTIAPNRPITVALVDPEGTFDLDAGKGTYQTTTGQTLILPRQAVVALNLLEPRPQEEIVITKMWSGKPKDKVQWTIALSTKSEKARAEAGEPDTLTCQLGASIEAAQAKREPVRLPTPIRKGPKRSTVPAPEGKPRLFDRGPHQPTCNAVLLPGEAACNCGPDGTHYYARGNGTYGPAPALEAAPLILPAAAAAGKIRPGQIPANVATKEILAFVNADPGTANWSADAKQDLCSTILIASFKAGYIGLWERSNG